MASDSLRDVRTHFEFGANWLDYASRIDEQAIAEAEAGLTRLVPAERLRGARFLDIGCGSGIHSLAALRAGAAEVLAVDIDRDSVEATSQLLRSEHPGRTTVRELSIFDAEPSELGRFDVVYSWGVLHHTGDMWDALERAAAFVKPGGVLAVALYQKRITCGLWTREKRYYTGAGPAARRLLRGVYKAAYYARLLATGRNPVRFVREYKTKRGMNFQNDVHDWLGGYPYESATPEEVHGKMRELGFSPLRENTLGRGLGLLGTGCAEYAFVNGPGR